MTSGSSIIQSLGNEKEWHEYRTRFEGPIQQWLDAGHGSCALKNPVVREIVVESFHHHDGTRYHLGDYVIMPNHVHVLLTPYGGHSMREIVTTWKRFTGHQILKRLRATAPFWLEESYDHIVRSECQLSFLPAVHPREPGEGVAAAGDVDTLGA